MQLYHVTLSCVMIATLALKQELWGILHASSMGIFTTMVTGRAPNQGNNVKHGTNYTRLHIKAV